MYKFFNSQWIGSALQQNPPPKFFALNKITSDTREVENGDLFVALQGESSDGHRFVTDAIAKGATAILVRRDFPAPTGVCVFTAADTLEAYRSLARAWRREFVLPVVAVAGSAGKTTTKELIAALLRGKYKNVLFTQSSQNGYQGIPATLLRIRAEHDAAVIEVGIDECDAMKKHLNLVCPDYGILTSIGEEHLEKLIDLDTVEKEEGLLFSALATRNGLAIVNLDDARIARQANLCATLQKISYSLQDKADLYGEVMHSADCWSLQLKEPYQEKIASPLPGKHNVANLLGAISVAHAIGLSFEEIHSGLATFLPPPGRSHLVDWKGVHILADTYNANPPSVIAAMETLPNGTRRYVALGDMLELGTHEENLHRSLAEAILKSNISGVFLFGDRMKALTDELQKRQYPGLLAHFSQSEVMAQALASTLVAGDALLIKGSRGMRMEKVLEFLQKL